MAIPRGPGEQIAGGGEADLGDMAEDEVGAAEEDEGRERNTGRFVGVSADQVAGGAADLQGLRVEEFLPPGIDRQFPRVVGSS